MPNVVVPSAASETSAGGTRLLTRSPAGAALFRAIGVSTTVELPATTGRSLTGVIVSVGVPVVVPKALTSARVVSANSPATPTVRSHAL